MMGGDFATLPHALKSNGKETPGGQWGGATLFGGGWPSRHCLGGGNER
jgi:hypothetical protein